MCEICDKPILMMVFRGTGVCCENCRGERKVLRELSSVGKASKK